MFTNKENETNLTQPNVPVSAFRSDANSDARIREAAEFAADILIAVLRLYILAFKAASEEDKQFGQCTDD